MTREQFIHTIEPVYNQHSKVLILGTFPSPKSREAGFYYGHPQNRFWRVIADLCNQPLPQTINEKVKLLLNNRIALWDVLYSCSITGADDNSIKDPIVNDLSPILQTASINAIFTTGGKAAALYKKYCFSQTKKEAITLPSTSPANCRVKYDKLKEAYGAILPYLGES